MAPSKYLFGHERKNGQNHRIHAFNVLRDDTLLSKPREIREEACVSSGGQSTQIKYLSKSTDTIVKYYSSKIKVLLF